MNQIGASVVITVLNEAESVCALIEGLINQSQPPDEIIVVDGGSTDGTFEQLTRMAQSTTALRVISMPGANIAQGRNHGVKLARNEIIACTDAGCQPHQNWLERIVAPFADRDVDVVGGAYAIAPRSWLERVVGLLTLPGQLSPFEPHRFNPSARSIAFRRSTWRRAGGFPDWLHTAEDTLFACKLRQLGCVFAFAEDAIVRWRPRTTFRATLKQFHDYARGEARIGRGDGGRFWKHRYAMVLTALVVGLAATPLSGWIGPVTGAFVALGLIIHACHARAVRVAHRTRNPFDYFRSVILEHGIAIASIKGHKRGRMDREQNPARFLRHLYNYWGEIRLTDPPLWRMKTTPAPKTLIISWHWPPTNRASTAVIANLLRSADGQAFSAITRDMPEPPDADRTDAPPMPTQRVRWLLKDDQERTGWTWIASIIACAKLAKLAAGQHRHGGFQKILGVYPHRYSVLAALFAARITGAPLVLWMHDLLSETLITNSRLKRAFWRWVESAAIGHAELIITPTPQFAMHYRKRGARATWILPHCRNPRIKPAARPAPSDRLRLQYSGSAYQAHIDAIQLLVGAVDARPDVTLDLYTNQITGIDRNRTQWLSRTEAIARLRDADVLVVALAKDSPYPAEVYGCFPSKLVDYFAAAKAILAIVPPNSFVDRLIRTTGCGIVVTHYDKTDVNAALDRLKDPATRELMGQRSLDLAFQLESSRWMNALCKRLAGYALDGPDDPRFPIPPRAIGSKETVADVPEAVTT